MIVIFQYLIAVLVLKCWENNWWKWRDCGKIAMIDYAKLNNCKVGSLNS